MDPFDARLEDEVERERLRRIFTQGLDAIVGYVLPIRRLGGREGSWATGRWFLRDERLYLFPGDSPMGLRLPLDSLPWSHPDDLLTVGELDPFAPRAPLATARQRDDPRSAGLTSGVHGVHDPAEQSRVGAGEGLGADSVTGGYPSRGQSAAGVVRSALCVEPRDGVLYVFMPPVQQLEHYLDLVGAIEETARSLGVRVLLEGYPPPSDPRLLHFSVTPDPGVIEVNVQPASRLGCARRADDDALRRCEARGPLAGEVHARRPPHRNRWRQSFRARGLDTGRQPVPSAAGPAAKPHHVLAQPPVPVVPLLRVVPRPDKSGASDR